VRSLLLALAVAVGCHPADAIDDSADDTGHVPLADYALGGQRPGFVDAADDPLSTFPLDGTQPYEGELPEAPPSRFAVRTQVLPIGADRWRVDVGVTAGAQSAVASDIGVRLAFNPLAVERYRLVDALGSGRGIAEQRVDRLLPGASAGATYELLTHPTARRHGRFLGTVTLSWTEAGSAQQRVMVLERPDF
jgi:hypothetical protein